MQVNIYNAKTQLSQLVEAAHKGETIVIAKGGTPMANLVPLDEGRRTSKIRFGGMKGEVWIADDFDVLPDDILAAFEGRDPP